MTITTRRERRQQQRRQEARRSGGSGGGGGSRGLSQIWIVAGVIVAVVALILAARAAGVFDAPATDGTIDINSPAYDVAGATIGTHQDEIGKSHVPTGQKVAYPSLPPTSGDHWAQPAAPAPWGIKTAVLPFEVSTHNLEHGGIVILYAADLTTPQVDQLRSLVRQLQTAGFAKIVLEPWPDMPKDSKVILTAWNWIMKLPGIDAMSIVKFTKAHHASPEAPEPNVP
jgi:hypothetical protein